jgi:peptide/nickel transport system substrate-binding protein
MDMRVAKIGLLFVSAVLAALVLAVATACGEKEVIRTVEVPVERIVEKEVVKIQEVEVPGETVVVEKEVVKIQEVEVPGETVVKEVVRIQEVEVPGETVVREVIREVEVPGETVVVEKVVEKVQTVQVEIPVPVPSATELTYPVPGSNLTIVVKEVGPPVWHTPIASHPFGGFDVKLGIQENLLDYDSDRNNLPMLARSWEFDEQGITWHLQPGVPWHDTNYGTVNAEDVQWSMEEGIREGTVSAHAKFYEFDFTNPQILDSLTIRWDWKTNPSVRWAYTVRNKAQGVTVENKDYYEDVGEDEFIKIPMGTGPYRLTSHVADDIISLEAVRHHWRTTGGWESVRVVEVPEQTTRIAMLKSGVGDITDVGVPLLDQVEDDPDLRLVYGSQANKAGAIVFLGGNWQIRIDEDGNPGTPLHISNPWVGNPDIPGDLERAKKIRMAMSYAIDREALNDVILGGQGCVSFLYTVDTCHPRYNSAWSHPYDPNRAKELLAEGGFADGFDFNFWIPSAINETHIEVSEAFLPMWENIGLKAIVDKSTYSARRPQIVGREMVDAWSFFFGGNISDVELYADIIPDVTTRVLWNGGYDHPDAYELVDRLLVAFDHADAWDVVEDFWAFESHLDFMPTFGTVSWTDPWVVGPNVGRVEMVDHGESDMPELEGIHPADH